MKNEASKDRNLNEFGLSTKADCILFEYKNVFQYIIITISIEKNRSPVYNISI